MQKPQKLIPGSRIAVLAPSFIADRSAVDNAENTLSQMGFYPVLFPSCYASWGYFSGSDSLRASDINQAFRDSSIDGIFCLRGGYGAARLLPLLDYNAIRSHPKVFIGYSDVTALHLVLQQRCHLVTFHGPMAAALPAASAFTKTSLLRNLLYPKAYGPLTNPDNTPLTVFNPPVDMSGPVSGTSASPSRLSAEGILTGGNLTTLCSLLGTPYEPDTRGKILFLEEIGEQLYRVDRMLTSLVQAGKIDSCAGILLGRFTDCGPDRRHPSRNFTLEEIFRDRLCSARPSACDAAYGTASIPVFTGLCCGHTDPSLTLPLGTRVRLNPVSASACVLESGVTP